MFWYFLFYLQRYVSRNLLFSLSFAKMIINKNTNRNVFSVSVTTWSSFSEQKLTQKLAFYFTNFAFFFSQFPLHYSPSLHFYFLWLSFLLSLSSTLSIILFWLVSNFYSFFFCLFFQFIFSQKQISECLILVDELCWLSVNLHSCFSFLHLLLKFVMVLPQVTLGLLVTKFVSRFLSIAVVFFWPKNKQKKNYAQGN